MYKNIESRRNGTDLTFESRRNGSRQNGSRLNGSRRNGSRRNGNTPKYQTYVKLLKHQRRLGYVALFTRIVQSFARVILPQATELRDREADHSKFAHNLCRSTKTEGNSTMFIVFSHSHARLPQDGRANLQACRNTKRDMVQCLQCSCGGCGVRVLSLTNS